MENIDNVQVEKSFINNKEINDYLLETAFKLIKLLPNISLNLFLVNFFSPVSPPNWSAKPSVKR